MSNFLSQIGEEVSTEYITDPKQFERYVSNNLYIWGLNNAGQLGTNDITNRSSPVQTISATNNWEQVSVYGRTSAGIKSDGSLWLWGRNLDGQLGTNNTTDRSSPVQTISAGNNWKLLSCGCYHTTAIKNDGTLWLWGDNTNGGLGTNDLTFRSSPVQTVSAGTDWKLVAGGFYITAAIKMDNSLWIWGRNTFGQLGDNTAISKSSPIQTVSAGTDWKQVACGLNHVATIKNDGTLWLWGNNGYGQLGNNASIDRSSPVQTVAGGTDWKQVACGDRFTGAIKNNGTLWIWGQNVDGQLGNNASGTNISSPIQTVAGGTDWKLIEGGGAVAAAIKTDGTLWGWGNNGLGQLGTNDIVHRSSPVQTIAGGTNWKQFSRGGGHMLAVTYSET